MAGLKCGAKKNKNKIYFKHEKIVITSKENHRSRGGGMFEEYIIARLSGFQRLKFASGISILLLFTFNIVENFQNS